MRSVLMLSDAVIIHTIRWVNATAARDWKVHLLSIRAPRQPLDERVTVHQAPWPPPWGYIANAGFVRQKVREIHPDLIHAHYASGYGTLAALADRHPLILSVWGSDVYDFPEKSPVNAWLIRRALRKSDLILSTSRAMAVQTRRYIDRDIPVTPFGIDVDQFRPKPVESPFAPSDIVIGTVKVLAEKYGIQYLIRAFALVKKKHSDLPLKLLIVGGGPQEAFLKKLVEDLGISAQTTFTGRVEHARVPDYFNMLSIPVFASTLDSESFGVAVLEASACAKPVVVSSVGGLPEVVEDGVTGLVVPRRDPERTADAIERLVLDPALRERMGTAGRERVIKQYEWGHCVDLMMSHYDAVLNGKRAKS
jgi:glycosyltransferase involved in cell wall biosynthesis